jgi:adenosine kinase
MTICISGSLAFDTIMQFEGRFADHILPDKVHMLNVSFFVPGMRREYGGCAGNIAYGVSLLGGDARPLATIGSDGAAYLERFASLGINTRGIKVIADTYTAQCFITTDQANNQITAFHPGAMALSHCAMVADTADAAAPLVLGIVSPDGKEGMVQHAQDLATNRIPFIWDPGQALPLFSGAELLKIMEQATYLAVNDYEGHLVEQKTSSSLISLSHQLEGVIVTKGEQGVDVLQKGSTTSINAVPAEKLVDPTGCGDAFRAGLLQGLSMQRSLLVSAQMGCVMGSRKIASAGGQNYQITLDELEQAVIKYYGK